MTRQELLKIAKKVFDKCVDVMVTKGRAYSGGDEDSLANFKRVAREAEVSVEKVWLTYYLKHYDSLRSHIRGLYCDSEPLEGRIVDLINYLIIYLGISIEKERNNNGT